MRGEPQTLIRVSQDEGARVFFTALTNAFVAAGLCLIFWMMLRSFDVRAGEALLGTAVLAFATPVWVYSRDLFGDPMFACCLLGTCYLLMAPGVLAGRRRVVWAGLISGLGILTRISFLPICGIFAAFLFVTSGGRTRGARRVLEYMLFCAPALGVAGVLNMVRFGGIAQTGYHTAFDKGFSVPLADGLRWNFVSPYRSLFLYAPPVALFFIGLVGFARRYAAQLTLIVSIIIYMFVVYSKWWAWHGGWCWGPRFLLPVIPLLLVPGLVVMSRHRKWLLPATVVLGLLGLAVQLGGILINYTAVYDYWIKIGRLDWAEANIHTFSPVATHLRAVLATGPANYDLWFIQSCSLSWVACLGLAACAVTALLALRFLLRRTS